MIKILFIRSKNAFLPEIDAYINFFNKTSEFLAFDSSKVEGDINLDDYDIIWEFKGLGGVNNSNKIVVHEYASLSTGLFPKIKNSIKKFNNRKPDLRVFLNERVASEFNFVDDVPSIFRDMGFNEKLFKVNDTDKEYKFVYVGAVTKKRHMDKFLKNYVKNNNGKICLVGNVEESIYNKFKKNKNICFYGSVPYEQVPGIVSKAEYGINYIPDKYPFNIQTSTKLIEYIALGLKIITTDYYWVRQFEKDNNCSFYKLLTNQKFNQNEIENFEFSNNINLEKYYWDEIIKNSGIYSELIRIYEKRKIQK